MVVKTGRGPHPESDSCLSAFDMTKPDDSPMVYGRLHFTEDCSEVNMKLQHLAVWPALAKRHILGFIVPHTFA
jgi:hypothetical protein